MDHDDRFRSLFGFPSGFAEHDRFGRFPNQAPYDSEVEDNGFPFGDAGDIFSRFRFGGFGRSSPFNDMNDVFRGAESMLRHMDSMFRDMHSFGEYGGSFGRTTGQNDHEEKDVESKGDPHWNRRRTARDEMLKVPDSEVPPMKLEDRDLDAGFVSGDIKVDDLLQSKQDSPRENQPYMQRQRSGNSMGFTGSSSVTTFIGSGDGRAEQRTTVQNSDGSQSTTVTRRIGEREYITTTKIFGNGEKEVHEELVNMDETESGRFNAEWSSPTATRNALKQNLEHDQQMDNRRMGPLLDPKGPGLFSRLFKSWW